MATPEQQRRIDAEARLLQAVVNDDVEGLAPILHGDVPMKDLLRLRVKPTYNDCTDDTGFYHSIASFGLSFGLGENAAQLARRNDSMDVAVALEAVADGEGRGLYESRLAAEAELLAAIRSDSGEQVRQIMKKSLDRHLLAEAVVKDTYHDAADQGAIYHLVASYGLTFQIGDTLYDLAKRNDCKNAEKALRRWQSIRLARLDDDPFTATGSMAAGPTAPTGPPPPRTDAPMDLKVHLTNAMTGADVCTLSASSQWTIALLARAAASEVPSPGGCRLFLKGAAALTAGTVLADLQEEDAEVVQLSTVVMSAVDGIYAATVKLGDFPPDPGHAAGRRLIGGVIRGRDPPARIGLKLEKGGEASFIYQKHPFDRGHCAPPSGGHWVRATGTWTFSVPGIQVVLTDGREGHFQRGVSSEDGRFRQEQVILLAMVKEGQFDVVRSDGRHPGGSRTPTVPAGTALVKQEAADGAVIDFDRLFGRAL